MMVNDGIRAREVRLIGADGDQLGIKSKDEAMQIAEAAGLDLVVVAPKAKPMVAKVIDYGKYRFEQQKKARLSRKKQKVVSVKEIRLNRMADSTSDVASVTQRAKMDGRSMFLMLAPKSSDKN